MWIQTSCIAMAQKITKLVLPRPSKARQLGSKMVSNHPKAAKTHSNFQKGHFFLPGTPMEEAEDAQNRAPKQLPRHSKGLVLDTRASRFLDNFQRHVSMHAHLTFLRMSVAFCLFLIIANAVKRHHERLISMVISHTCPSCVRNTKRHHKKLLK